MFDQQVHLSPSRLPFPSLALHVQTDRETGNFRRAPQAREFHRQRRDRSFRRPTTIGDPPASGRALTSPPSRNLQTSRHGASRFHRPRRPGSATLSPTTTHSHFFPSHHYFTYSIVSRRHRSPADLTTVTTPSRAHSTFFFFAGPSNYLPHTPSARSLDRQTNAAESHKSHPRPR